MDEYQGYRFPLTRIGRKNSAGATNEEITIGPVPSGHLWVVTNLAIEDETTAFTSFRAYIGGLGENQYLLEDFSLLAGRLYWFAGSLYIAEGRTLVLRFVGTTNADKLAGYVNGFDVIQPKGGPHA